MEGGVAHRWRPKTSGEVGATGIGMGVRGSAWRRKGTDPLPLLWVQESAGEKDSDFPC